MVFTTKNEEVTMEILNITDAKHIIGNNKVVFVFYLMVIPLSILFFFDFVIKENCLYQSLHIALAIIYFITFYLYKNNSQEINTTAVITDTIPTAPPIIIDSSNITFV